MTPDFDKVATQLERFAALLRQSGREAWRNARDWQSPLKSSEGGPGHADPTLGGPTAAAAMNRIEGKDRLSEQFARLRMEVEGAYDAATTGSARVLLLIGAEVPENQRAGIGHCMSCNKYCDGTSSNRLRNGECPACTQRHNRNKQRAS